MYERKITCKKCDQDFIHLKTGAGRYPELCKNCTTSKNRKRDMAPKAE